MLFAHFNMHASGCGVEIVWKVSRFRNRHTIAIHSISSRFPLIFNTQAIFSFARMHGTLRREHDTKRNKESKSGKT